MGKVFGCSEGTILRLFARSSRDFGSIMADCGMEWNASSCDSVLTGELHESTYTTISSWLRCLEMLVGGLHTSPDHWSTPEFFTRYASWFLRMRIRMVLNVGMTNASRHRYLRLTAYKLMLSWAGEDVNGIRSLHQISAIYTGYINSGNISTPDPDIYTRFDIMNWFTGLCGYMALGLHTERHPATSDFDSLGLRRLCAILQLNCVAVDFLSALTLVLDAAFCGCGLVDIRLRATA